MDSGFIMKPQERQAVEKWISGLGKTGTAGVGVVSWQQSWGKLYFGRSIINTPLCLNGKEYGWGLGTHADSEIVSSQHPTDQDLPRMGRRRLQQR